MEELKTEIEIEKVIPAIDATPQKVEVVKYDRDFIENQIIDITAQRDSYIRQLQEQLDLKNSELKECEDILLEMNKQGIVSKATIIKQLIKSTVKE